MVISHAFLACRMNVAFKGNGCTLQKRSRICTWPELGRSVPAGIFLMQSIRQNAEKTKTSEQAVSFQAKQLSVHIPTLDNGASLCEARALASRSNVF